MFARLFQESGLSLDRLRALVEVGAAGSIVKASGGDPIKQSQYSRQIKELEDFFQAHLIERQGKGIRLTAQGKELARISRFFLLGLSNFQRGCLTEGQTFRIGASATFIQQFLLPAVTTKPALKTDTRYKVETVIDEDIERRLHELTLDFGIVTAPSLSRPLQLQELSPWRLQLWVPPSLFKNERQALSAFNHGHLPLVLAMREWSWVDYEPLKHYEPALACDTFLEAKAVLEKQSLSTFLPNFLAPSGDSNAYLQVRVAAMDSTVYHYRLAWNPRLLRLNLHAGRMRDQLLALLS